VLAQIFPRVCAAADGAAGRLVLPGQYRYVGVKAVDS
jgi:hypothetical protein